jgi:hypothetical protein
LVLFLVGVVGFTAAFGVYARVFGRLDGLPPLPPDFLVRRSADDADVLPPARSALIDIKLQRAFGPGCAETSYNHRLELQKNGVILATNQLTIEPDGRCKLKPFSIAVVKERGPAADPEVHAVHADEAYILFDEPVKNLAEMGKRRIVGCDLISDPSLLSPDPRAHRITCTHNRGTADAEDDLLVETTGPVQYREVPANLGGTPPPQVRTTSAVRLTDRHGQPQATTVTAQGMSIYLASAPANPPAGTGKPKSGSISGVRRVVLPENVTMNLWIDPKDGFLATGRAKPAPAGAPAERSNVQITTPGPFAYEVGEETDRARFDMKPAGGPGQAPGFVQVVRPMTRDNLTLYDRLDCDALELQFVHKPAGKPAEANAAKGESGTSLQWAHAWGEYVVLTSQSDNLQAHGNDLFHDAARKHSILKGRPEVVAIKDGHEIHAPELVLVNAEGSGRAEAFARGAGYFKGQLTGQQAGRDGPRAVVARWRDRMHYRKEDGQELITLTGAASFEDPDRDQSLAGEQIKVTMAPDPAAAPTPGQPRMKPRRLEVTGNVQARSAELTVRDTELLVVLFRDGPPRSRPMPHVSTGSSAPPAPAPAAPPADVALGKPADPKPAGPPKPPLELTARSVQATLVNAAGGPTELDTVHCEGSVRVHQDPTPPQAKPVDMLGETLDVTRRPEGHKLVVTGDEEKPAEVHLPELSILGPSVEIDQVENVAEVHGPGAMRVLSATDFQGNKLAKPTELHVSWKDEMHFNGTLARFQGYVQAHQDNTRLLCHGMQVTLDRTVQFNQHAAGGNKGGKTANVERVVCETTGRDGAAPVSVVDSLRDDKGRIVRYQRLESRELAVFKAEGRLEAPGPGEVRILQLGPKNETPAPTPPATGPKLPAPKTAGPPPPAEEEMKLTYVRFDNRLTVFNESRVAKFRKNVEVLHLPADDPALQTNFNALVNKLPPRALYLKCEQLTVFTQDRDAKKGHVLKAEERATVQFDNFYGQADVISFDEDKQQVIFEGRGRPASLSQLQARGQKPKTFKGYKFTYNRATGQFDGNDVISISEN